MKLQFLGAATTVTGSQFLLTTDRARILIDCGLFQGSPSEAARNRLPIAYDPKTIDAILVTHAHLDHCGMLPVVVKDGYTGPIHLTRATAELARLVLLDSGKVQVEQAQAHQDRMAREARREQRAHDAGVSGAPTANTGPGAAAAPTAQVAPAPAPPAAAATATPAGAPQAGAGLDPEALLRAQPPHLDWAIQAPLYTVDDAQAVLQYFVPLDYGQTITVAPGITATFMDAGHILGSAIILVDVEQADGTSRRIVFSGDVGRPDTPILRDPTAIVDGADYVLMESTYGGREHDPEDEAVRMLAEAVNAVASHSGVLLIPSFAIGRTQEIVWQLDRLLSAGSIPHVPLYLDSPMASSATEIYRRYPDYYDAETRELLAEGQDPIDYPGQIVTNDSSQSKAIAKAPRPMMIVSASGMLTGGRIVHHLANLIDDPAALLLFVGYQGEGTLGAHLQAGAKEVRLDGNVREVRCQIRSISGFSAHADENELIAWLSHFASAPRKPKRVFLVHGDPDAELALVPRVKAIGLDPYRPAWHEVVELA